MSNTTEGYKGSHLKVALELIQFKSKTTGEETNDILKKLRIAATISNMALADIIELIQKNLPLPSSMMNKLIEAKIIFPSLQLDPTVIARSSAPEHAQRASTTCAASLTIN